MLNIFDKIVEQRVVEKRKKYNKSQSSIGLKEIVTPSRPQPHLPSIKIPTDETINDEIIYYDSQSCNDDVPGGFLGKPIYYNSQSCNDDVPADFLEKPIYGINDSGTTGLAYSTNFADAGKRARVSSSSVENGFSDGARFIGKRISFYDNSTSRESEASSFTPNGVKWLTTSVDITRKKGGIPLDEKNYDLCFGDRINDRRVVRDLDGLLPEGENYKIYRDYRNPRIPLSLDAKGVAEEQEIKSSLAPVTIDEEIKILNQAHTGDRPKQPEKSDGKFYHYARSNGDLAYNKEEVVRFIKDRLDRANKELKMMKSPEDVSDRK